MNNKTSNRNMDWIGASVFITLTFGFILLMVFNSNFSDWAWNRHHNILSWYIRPLALLPFMFFAFKRSLTGMAFSIFALATSMAWFPAPETAEPAIIEFLQMEVEYLTTNWTSAKVMGTLIVPVMFVLLGAAFWKRSFLYGGLVLIANVVLKLAWGVIESGESGWAMLPPALFGLALTLGLVYFAHWRQSKTAKLQTA